ncbi:DUF1559 family PulG-like putative transporter [Paludisphaera rhizosphaerae]|uniref:DUF1559 family PulG-like putative transporter n=1 Tax=Paludisphaera rhizosphaerae TaxID=2711216 RepID=UPI0013EA5F85|nr:DUF1559 domain-containing protein [Paludisphaera rhizosphaerae]
MTLPSSNDPEFRDPAKAKSASRGRSCLIQALLTTAILALLVALMLPAVRTAGEAAKRSQCVNNLKQIMLALHNYADVYGALPPAYTVDADGRRLHSWRTLILPFLEQNDLYQAIDLAKPWDDPSNSKAFATPIHPYWCPSADDPPTTSTVYRASVGPHAFLRTTEPRPFATISDGTAATLAVVEVAPEDAVPWMSPEDADEPLILKLEPDSKLQHSGGVNIGFADGSVRFLKATIPPAVRRALITVDGGEAVSSDQY